MYFANQSVILSVFANQLEKLFFFCFSETINIIARSRYESKMLPFNEKKRSSPLLLFIIVMKYVSKKFKLHVQGWFWTLQSYPRSFLLFVSPFKKKRFKISVMYFFQNINASDMAHVTETERLNTKKFTRSLKLKEKVRMEF